MKTIFLATNNPYKVEEVKAIAEPYNIKIERFKCDIRELQTIDRQLLIRHKIVEAFKQCRMPVLVDHASLEIHSLNGMPGTLTQLFWDKLQSRICDIVNALGDYRAIAISTVAYCDGKEIFNDEGSVAGLIAKQPYCEEFFQWDTIFIPEGQNRTYAEIKKTDSKYIDMHRQLAFNNLFSRISNL